MPGNSEAVKLTIYPAFLLDVFLCTNPVLCYTQSSFLLASLSSNGMFQNFGTSQGGQRHACLYTDIYNKVRKIFNFCLLK